MGTGHDAAWRAAVLIDDACRDSAPRRAGGLGNGLATDVCVGSKRGPPRIGPASQQSSIMPQAREVNKQAYIEIQIQHIPKVARAIIALPSAGPPEDCM